MAGLAMENAELAAAVEKGAVYAATVGGIVMDDAIIEAAQHGAGNQLPHNSLILHLRQADYIWQPAELVPGEADGLGDSVAFVPKMRLGFEQVFNIPKHKKAIRFPAKSSREPEKHRNKKCQHRKQT